MELSEELIKDVETIGIKPSARKHGVNPTTLRFACNNQGIKSGRKQGSNQHYKANIEEPKMIVRGKSTLLDEDGNIKLEWIKESAKEMNSLDTFKEALELMLDNPLLVKQKKTLQPISFDRDTMSVYTIGDAHVGMLAWDKETGADNDLDTVQNDLLSAMNLLVEQAHPSEEAFIVDVGDWFHSDNQNNTTSKSSNNLDVDGRYPKVLNVGLQLTLELIEMALTKHKTVRWRSAIGNHNEHSAIMMTAFIATTYKNEPRVIVHDTPNMFMYHAFGKNLIGITHGHTAKAEKLGEIMSVDCENIWSVSKYRYWYTGHIHHQSTKEFPSCVVETFRTLAGKDAWHSASGYRSGQDMRSITLHKEYGEISRNTVSLAMARQLAIK